MVVPGWRTSPVHRSRRGLWTIRTISTDIFLRGEAPHTHYCEHLLRAFRTCGNAAVGCCAHREALSFTLTACAFGPQKKARPARPGLTTHKKREIVPISFKREAQLHATQLCCWPLRRWSAAEASGIGNLTIPGTNMSQADLVLLVQQPRAVVKRLTRRWLDASRISFRRKERGTLNVTEDPRQ